MAGLLRDTNPVEARTAGGNLRVGLRVEAEPLSLSKAAGAQGGDLTRIYPRPQSPPITPTYIEDMFNDDETA
jgi:hypothetical protein